MRAASRTWLPVAGAFFVYAAASRWLGFVLATAALVAFIALRLGARARAAMAFALIFSSGTWVLFQYLLGVTLPVGELWTALATVGGGSGR